MFQNLFVFGDKNIVTQASVCHDQAVEWVTGPVKRQRLDDNCVERPIADLEADPPRQIRDDSIGSLCHALNLMQIL